ncbi:MAG: cadmium-translocating P-type ATPase [Bacteroides sp.]|nr:cadmium-translocating P-type ATPase [Roseburia sp.]MCM1347171.1 cadmium-translocating P-type ATPase [Bacteroides sp.]MCM1421163.1 cadmium-translocating P-type ATPase [Bacteroides sp.]
MKQKMEWIGVFRLELLSAVMLAVGMLAEHSGTEWFVGIVQLLWFVAAFFPVGFPVLREAVGNMRHGSFCNEFMLMTLAAVGAFYIGEYPEGVAVMLFYSVGEKLQDIATDSARSHIASLVDLRPDTTRVIRDGKEGKVRSEEVRVGDLINVRVGERLSVDGTLLSDSAAFNASAITGESTPVTLYKGDEVMAGFIPVTDMIQVKALRNFEHSALSRILTMVEEASERKAPAELFIRKFARVYTPAVVGLSVLLVLIPLIYSLFVPEYCYVLDDWLYRALVFLVVSCPCALVISIPLGYFGGIGAASTKGILFKGGSQLDMAARINAVAFDKTGTLTTGQFEVKCVMPAEAGEYSKEDILRDVVLAEKDSNHPIAVALKKYADECHMLLPADETDFKTVSGLGMTGILNGDAVLVGNRQLLENNGVKVPQEVVDIEELTVLCSVNGKYVGCVILEDSVKDGALHTVEELNSLGIRNLFLLSGDKRNIVARLANRIGIVHAEGDMLPDSKVDYVSQLKQRQGYTVAFVGDGINDAPVLACSDMGVAMGAMGSDVAIEAADIVIQDDNPVKIADAIEIGRKTRRIVTENILLSIGVKVVVIFLGALGLTSLWMAVFADVGVSLLAIFNALRLRFVIERKDTANGRHLHTHLHASHHHCGCGCH